MRKLPLTLPRRASAGGAAACGASTPARAEDVSRAGEGTVDGARARETDGARATDGARVTAGLEEEPAGPKADDEVGAKVGMIGRRGRPGNADRKGGSSRR